MLLWKAGGGEGGDRVRQVWERQVCVSYQPLAHVRVHDQLHPQTEAPAREVHDEQRSRELYHPPGWHTFLFIVAITSMYNQLTLSFYFDTCSSLRLSRTGIRRKRYCARHTCSRCQRPNTALSITYTDWSKTSLLEPARHAAIHPHQCLPSHKNHPYAYTHDYTVKTEIWYTYIYTNTNTHARIYCAWYASVNICGCRTTLVKHLTHGNIFTSIVRWVSIENIRSMRRKKTLEK